MTGVQTCALPIYTCSYCGGLNPAEVVRLIKEEGAWPGRTDKSYKLYLQQNDKDGKRMPQRKVYFPHFSKEDMDALNAATQKCGCEAGAVCLKCDSGTVVVADPAAGEVVAETSYVLDGKEVQQLSPEEAKAVRPGYDPASVVVVCGCAAGTNCDKCDGNTNKETP